MEGGRMETRMDVDGLEAKLLSSSCNGSSDAACVSEKLSVDGMLTRWVGEFGWAQLVHFVVVSIAWTVEGLHTLVMIFADREPSWQCRPSVVSPTLNVTVASGLSSGLMDMSCTPSSSLCSMDPSAWEWIGGHGVSTVTEWGLICGDEYKVGLAQSALFLGGFVGAGVFGNLSDSVLGRKGALFLAVALTGVSGLTTSMAPSYWVYVALRGLTGLSCSGVGLSSFVLATEPVGPSKRGKVGMSAFYFFSLGIMILPAVAYFTPSWRLLYVVTSIPSLLYCALVLPFVWESPRWFIVQGRIKEAMDVLRAFAKGNGKYIPEGVELDIETDEEATNAFDVDNEGPADEKSSSDTPKAAGTLLDVFRNSATRGRMLIMVVIWFLCAVVYYGISLNVVNLGTNLYLGVFLNAAIEWPAFAVTAVFLDRLGRRSMLVSAMLLSGCCCLVGSFLYAESGTNQPDGLTHLLSEWAPIRTQSYQHVFWLQDTNLETGIGVLKMLRILCSVVGIFGMAATYNLIYIYTTELFPTVVRNAALGLTTQSSGIGSIIAPVVVVLGRYSSALPFAIFGIMAIVGAFLSLCLPETLHQPLFETLEGLVKTMR